MDKICNGKSFKVGRCGRMKTLNDHAELTKSHAKKTLKKRQVNYQVNKGL